MYAFMQYAFHSWLINTCSVYRPVVVVESLVTFTKTFNSFVSRTIAYRKGQEHTPPSNVPTTCIAPILGAVNTHKGPCNQCLLAIIVQTHTYKYCIVPYMYTFNDFTHDLYKLEFSEFMKPLK